MPRLTPNWTAIITRYSTRKPSKRDLKNFLLDISAKFLILSIIMNRLFAFVKKQTKRIVPFPSGRRVCGV
jgi:hypothetical protein